MELESLDPKHPICKKKKKHEVQLLTNHILNDKIKKN
jgi:hypothetical protein